ncbi:uncharacterized protein LOC128888067 [Hylaeus anthracinus]|uniref:uncharacterized protein LOC128873287 n=1 Tax=Hylaeus volcanicus TaxID=313075 RepID=UPI0023B8832D|nr:uncharacterized protein LOC128873287 [Hylaeus volcanicus]XP_054000663.1 uncharacterized protein LOC128888067 [Hylaeus anthracinus]
MESCVADDSEYVEYKVPPSEMLQDKSNNNDDVLRTFIETYEALPELWNSMHTYYSNKARRNLALDKLADIYGKLKPGANRDDVRKKINTLRSNYRKELRKIAAMKRYGNGKTEDYQPASWVFHAMKFIDNCDQPLNGSVAVATNSIQHDDGLQTSEFGQTYNNVAPEEDFKEHSPEQFYSEASRSSIIPPPPRSENEQQVFGTTATQNELLSLAYKYLKKMDKPQEDMLSIAKVWGEKLRTLDHHQRLFAEKAINDVLFEASLGNLHRYSVKINEDSYH